MVKLDFSCIPCILLSGQMPDPAHHSPTHEELWRQGRRHYVVLMCCSLSAAIIFNYAVSTPLPLCLLCATGSSLLQEAGSKIWTCDASKGAKSHVFLAWAGALTDSFMIYLSLYKSSIVSQKLNWILKLGISLGGKKQTNKPSNIFTTGNRIVWLSANVKSLHVCFTVREQQVNLSRRC